MDLIHRDPRDAPGTDDHDALFHPHGDALFYPWPFILGDLTCYVEASTAAHTHLAARYLELAEHEPMPPLCRGAHVETLTRGVEELPHAMRAEVQHALDVLERQTGCRLGLLRAWRHLGEDCQAAEAQTCGEGR